MPGRLLVVDDDVHIRRLIAIFCATPGYELAEASTADEALKMSQSERFDVVLLDLILPSIRRIPALSEIESGRASAARDHRERR